MVIISSPYLWTSSIEFFRDVRYVYKYNIEHTTQLHDCFEKFYFIVNSAHKELKMTLLSVNYKEPKIHQNTLEIVIYWDAYKALFAI